MLKKECRCYTYPVYRHVAHRHIDFSYDKIHLTFLIRPLFPLRIPISRVEPFVCIRNNSITIFDSIYIKSFQCVDEPQIYIVLCSLKHSIHNEYLFMLIFFFMKSYFRKNIISKLHSIIQIVFFWESNVSNDEAFELNHETMT